MSTCKLIRGGIVAVLLAAAFIAAVTWLVALPGVARADGDPASDTLLEQNVFYPYSSTASPASQNRLNAEVAAAHRAGIDLKVAIISQADDLGSVTAVYRQPQRYARFLDTELSYGHPIPLVVVMPNGFGVEGLPAVVAHGILTAARPSGAGATALAQAVSAALTRSLHGTGGVRPRAGGNRSGAVSGRTLLLLGLILAAVIVAGLLIALRFLVSPEEGQPGGGKR